MNSLRRKLSRYSRSFEPAWRFLYNAGPTLAYARNRKTLLGEAARVLAALNRDGIAMTSAAALWPQGADLFNDLAAAVAALRADWDGRISLARAQADDLAIGKKTFLLELLGHHVDLDSESAYARFALQPDILGIANAYLGMFTRLRYYNVWHTLTTTAPARESQLWHRDREDLYILKVFVYFSDVDAGAGPFTYAPGTHAKGRVRAAVEHSHEGGVQRSSDEQLAGAVPPERWVTATGPTGTLVFADTHGLHRGGLARSRDRLMYTCMFTSPASQSQEWFRRPAAHHAPADPATAFALTPPKGGLWLNTRP